MIIIIVIIIIIIILLSLSLLSLLLLSPTSSSLLLLLLLLLLSLLLLSLLSHQETPACAKDSCQTSFQSEEIWSHNSCTRYPSLASSQIPDWIQNTVDRLQRTSWQGTYLHPRNDHPIKKQKIFHKIQWRTCPEGSKIQAWYFREACIRSIWASGMELFAKGN